VDLLSLFRTGFAATDIELGFNDGDGVEGWAGGGGKEVSRCEEARRTYKIRRTLRCLNTSARGIQHTATNVESIVAVNARTSKSTTKPKPNLSLDFQSLQTSTRRSQGNSGIVGGGENQKKSGGTTCTHDPQLR